MGNESDREKEVEGVIKRQRKRKRERERKTEIS